jgi:beta-mannosidase
VKNPRLWWPKNSGEQNLYRTRVELLHNGISVYVYELNIGIRTVELENSECTDKEGNGEFCFKINGKKIFVLGTNWVPLDAIHSNDVNRIDKALNCLTI